MTTRLFLLRHADAGDPGAWQGSDDRRPLSKKGQRQAERLGAFLAATGFAPDAILSSPKVRALETAELVASAVGVKVTIEDRLGSGVDLEAVEQILEAAGNPTRPVVVGHDPDFSDILAELSGTTNAPMRKGALARIDVERPLEAGAGTLRWLVPPDLLTGKE